MTREEILNLQQTLNEKLAIKLKDSGIKNLQITSIGNSIASGYSIQRTIKPLLLRNENIDSTMKENNINIEKHAFARAQNNNEDHLFEWLISNIKESEINKISRSDYSGEKTIMPSSGLDETKLDTFYPIEISNDKGLKDIVESKENDTANILVYNGCTGSFLDNITRNGKYNEMFTYGIKRDIKSLESVLKYIQTSNRKNMTNTQIYICGAPDFLGLKITTPINRKLKKVCKQYANATYVEPIKAKFFYKNIETGKLGVDIHYDEEEYDKLNNNILSSIIENYNVNKSMINIDRKLYNFSSKIELDAKYLLDNENEIKKTVTDIIQDESKNMTPEEKEKFNKKSTDYLIEREPYDFYYIGKENIKKGINEEKKISK